MTVVDKSVETNAVKAVKADASNSAHVGSTMPGMVVAVAVKAGDKVKKGQKLLTLEAMKMETMINAEQDGEVTDVLVASGSQVETGDLLMVIE